MAPYRKMTAPSFTHTIMPSSSSRQGLLLGLVAYVLWGLFPLYFKLLQSIPAPEIIVHRVLWSALGSAVLLVLWKHHGWWRELLSHPKRLLMLVLSGALIACNWLIYVWAVNNGQMIDTSLGYYINPLVTVLLALVFLGERLRRLQWLAVALAFLGVAQQIAQLGHLPWVSLALALSFAFYGLIRKQVSVAALPGLAVETWLLFPAALIWLQLNPQAVSLEPNFWGTHLALWLAAAGPVTLVPLLCFNAAARRLPYSTLGFLQYLAPTLVLMQAVFLYDEPLPASKLIAFGCIWAALVLFSVDMWKHSRT